MYLSLQVIYTQSFQKYSKHFPDNAGIADFANTVITRWDKVLMNGLSKIRGRLASTYADHTP